MKREEIDEYISTVLNLERLSLQQFAYVSEKDRGCVRTGPIRSGAFKAGLRSIRQTEIRQKWLAVKSGHAQLVSFEVPGPIRPIRMVPIGQ